VSGNLYIGAPQGQPWPLTLDQVEPQLRRRFPDAYITRETMAVTGEPYLSFDVQLADGVTRHGIYVDRDNLAVSDGTPADWADTIAWFLTLLPDGTSSVVMAEDNPVPVPLPKNATTLSSSASSSTTSVDTGDHAACRRPAAADLPAQDLPEPPRACSTSDRR
jgi:hypothetical protein